MKILNCIIADDEPIARVGILKLVESRSDINVIATVGSVKEIENILSIRQDIDLIFLDIELSDSNGLEMVKHLSAPPMIIFTTAFSDYAIESYEVQAIDYLLKPISSERLDKALIKAHCISDFKSQSLPLSHITLRADRKYIKLKYADIIYFEGLKDYVSVYLSDHRIISRITIKKLIDLLPNDLFIRISKSHIINKLYIESYSTNSVTLCGSKTISVGPTYRKDINIILGSE